MTPRWRLRELTDAEHGSVDRLYSMFDLSQPAGYRSFLKAQAAAYLAIEERLDSAGAGRLIGDWDERRRSDQLRADLAELGGEATSRREPPPLRSDSEMLGALYVIEGSRMGGAVLAPRVAAGAPVRFLKAPAVRGAWRSLLALLDERLGSAAELDAAAGSARACFRCFEESALTELEPLLA